MPRPALVWNRTQPASDLLGLVSTLRRAVPRCGHVGGRRAPLRCAVGAPSGTGAERDPAAAAVPTPPLSCPPCISACLTMVWWLPRPLRPPPLSSPPTLLHPRTPPPFRQTSAALAASSMLYRPVNAAYAAELLSRAAALYEWGVAVPGEAALRTLRCCCRCMRQMAARCSCGWGG